MLKSLFLFTSVLLIMVRIPAQEVWTLQVCIDKALAENLTLKSSQYKRLSVKEEEKQSIRNMLPDISASSSYTIQGGRSVDPNTNEFVSNEFFFNDYSINTELDLFQGFQKRHQHASLKLLHEAMLEDQDQEKYLLAFRVMQAYVDVLYLGQSIEIAEDQIQISEKNMRFVKRQIEVGLIAGSDIHRAESAVISDQLQLTRSINQYRTARLTLMQEMNIVDYNAEFRLESIHLADSHGKSTYQPDTLYQQSLEFLPAMRAQGLKVRSAEKELKQRRGLLFPSLMAYAGYGSGYFETNVDADDRLISFNKQLKNNSSQYYGLALNIPISDRWTRRSQLNQEKIDLLQVHNQNAIQKQELYRSIQKLVSDFKSTESELALSIEQESALRNSFEVAQQKFEKGLFSALDLDIAKNLLFNAQSDHLQLEMKRIVLRKTLDFYAGNPAFDITTIQ